MGPGLHATLPHGSKWIQKFLSHHRGNIRVQPQHHSCIDVPSLRYLRHGCDCLFVELWESQRAHVVSHQKLSTRSLGLTNSINRHITIAKAFAVCGFVLACATTNVGARYFAMCLFACGVYVCNSIILGWVSNTCGQTKEKKALSLAIVNTIAAIGPVYTPYFWPESDEPRYVTAMTTSAAFSLIAAILAWVMRFMLIRQNRVIRQSSSEAVLFYAY